MGEAEEVERGAVRVRMTYAPRPMKAKVDEVRLVRVEREPVPCKPFTQHVHDPLDVVESLERHHAVIGVPHEDAVPFEAHAHVPLEPFIQHVVQVDVCEQRRDDAALRSALGRALKETVFEHARVTAAQYEANLEANLLARQPVRLSHPFQVDDMVKRGQSCPRFGSRQFGYPLSFRGQVRGAQGLLPCFPATALIPWRPPSLARVPVSPVPRGQRYYEGATTSRLRIPGRLSVSLPGSARSSAPRARLGGAPGWLNLETAVDA